MNRLGSGLLLLGKCLTADEIIERYDAVTREDIRDIAINTFDMSQLSFSAVGKTAPVPEYETLISKVMR